MNKYNVGDKVKIKTWERMKKEYKSDSSYIYTTPVLNTTMEEDLYNLTLNRTITIRETYMTGSGIFYHMEEVRWQWSDDMIECLAEDYVKPEPIKSRFEILDL